jgi:hypothetical protein
MGYFFVERNMRKLNSLLNENGISYFLVQKGQNPDVVVAAIHHAPIDISELPCDRHKISDEAVGQLALKVARILESTFIVASNYFLDLNKPDPNIRKTKEHTDYSIWLFQNQPQVLVEIHGHSGEKAKFDIEISSGEPRKDRSDEFAEKLKMYMSRCHFARDYSVSGNYNSIFYRASEAITINSDSWLAFHIELCPELRKDRFEAMKIARCIAYALRNICMALPG